MRSKNTSVLHLLSFFCQYHITHIYHHFCLRSCLSSIFISFLKYMCGARYDWTELGTYSLSFVVASIPNILSMMIHIHMYMILVVRCCPDRPADFSTMSRTRWNLVALNPWWYCNAAVFSCCHGTRLSTLHLIKLFLCTFSYACLPMWNKSELSCKDVSMYIC
jgi:hypothetical protein